MNEERASGAVFPTHVRDQSEQISEVRLRPLSLVSGRFLLVGGRRAPFILHGAVRIKETGDVVLRFEPNRRGEFSVRLPPGDYQVIVTGSEIHALQTEIRVGIDAAAIELGAIDLSPTYIVSQFGRQMPPLTGVEASNIPSSLDLERPRGKWLVIMFADTTDARIEYESAAQALRFVERYRKKREEYSILLIVNAESCKMDDVFRVWAANHPKEVIQMRREFGLLFDRDDSVRNRWEVRSRTMWLLVDRNGKLVDASGPSVWAHLARELRK